MEEVVGEGGYGGSRLQRIKHPDGCFLETVGCSDLWGDSYVESSGFATSGDDCGKTFADVLSVACETSVGGGPFVAVAHCSLVRGTWRVVSDGTVPVGVGRGDGAVAGDLKVADGVASSGAGG